MWEYDDKIVFTPGSNHFWTAKVKCGSFSAQILYADCLKVNGRVYGQGTGRRKSEAQEKAAQQALEALQQEYD